MSEQKTRHINTKRAVKNTFVLYARYLLLLFVALFTSRLNLQALGVNDYGLYNVIGGVSAMLGFVSTALTVAFQRFMSRDMVTSSPDRLKHTFGVGLWLHIMLVIVLALILETAGYWFVTHKLVIPLDRHTAAMTVFHTTVFTFLSCILLTPCNSVLLARENFTIYAWLSIFQALMRLGVSALLFILPFDKLKVYGLLSMVVSILGNLFCLSYCLIKYKEVRTGPVADSALAREIAGFTGWATIGIFGALLNKHGLNFLLNIYFGPALNAARGIAYAVDSAVTNLMSNFIVSIKPQIIKAYSTGAKRDAVELVNTGCKISFFMTLAFALPILLQTDYLLSLWLKNVPAYAAVFTQLVLLNSLAESPSHSLDALCHANGDLRDTQISCCIFYALNWPVAWFLAERGFPAYAIFISPIVLSCFSLVSRIYILSRLTGYSKRIFYTNVLPRMLTSSIISAGISLTVTETFLNERNFINFIAVCITTTICTSAAAMAIGLDTIERKKAVSYATEIIHKIRDKFLLLRSSH
ncbi:MAG: hypothetical protein K5838_01575 [Elusimicrobiales bacterium]|nr:hypothetical protein [Elusimicrobiales bacterium]